MAANISTVQKVKIIEYWNESKSIVVVRRKYSKFFNVQMRNAPTRYVINRIVTNFVNTGSVDKKKPPGRPSSVRTHDNINKVNARITQNGNVSQRRLSNIMNMKRTSLRRIMKEDLGCYPYKPKLLETINEKDFELRKKFAQKMINAIDNCSTMLKNMWFSDEAHFYLTGHVNKQNMRLWAQSNPNYTMETPLHPQKITVWCALSKIGIIGPYFIENTVNQYEYLNIINRFFKELKIKYPNTDPWFQQDGATCHCANAVLAKLSDFFGSNVISRRTNFEWPPRSPDLNPCDFYLWGYLKSKVYNNEPQNIMQLKKNIKLEIKKISSQTLIATIDDYFARLYKCVEVGGDHIEHLLK